MVDETTASVPELLGAMREIEGLASWHYDANADPGDPSPDDMTAHVNGLIVKVCRRFIGGDK